MVLSMKLPLCHPSDIWNLELSARFLEGFVDLCVKVHSCNLKEEGGGGVVWFPPVKGVVFFSQFFLLFFWGGGGGK